MTNATGDQSGSGDDGAYVIPLHTSGVPGSSAGSAMIRVSSANPSVNHSPPENSVAESFAAAAVRRHRAVALGLVLVLALSAGAGVAFQRHRADLRAHADEQYAADSVRAIGKAQGVVVGYRFPSSVERITGWRCSTRWAQLCGTSSLAPAAAADVVMARFATLGITAGLRRCDAEGSAGADCDIELRYGGGAIGRVRAVRNDVAYRVFGQPTSVAVHYYGVNDQQPDYASVTTRGAPVAEAFAKSSVAVPVVAALRCTSKSAARCVDYTAKRTVTGTAPDAWRAEGRRLVAAGWPTVRGICPPDNSTMCTLSAQRARSADGRDVVSVSTTFTPHGVKVAITAILHAYDNTVTY